MSCWLDPVADPAGRGERAVRFIQKLRHHEGRFAGKPFLLRPWQERIIRRIYGDTDANGRRRVRTVFILLPRGNGKSTLAAAIALLHTFGPEAEAAGQVISAAADREQASICFNAAARMIRQDARLSSSTRITDSRKTILHPRSGSVYRAISSEAYSKHGLSITCLIADEVHAWPGEEGRELWTVLTTSMGKRDNPLTVVITTAGVGQTGIAWELYSYAKRVAAGEVEDPTFLPILFEPAAGADWQDEAVWHQVNPALSDGFRSLEEMRTAAMRAAEVPAQREAFKRLYLNIWSDGAAAPWLDMATYDDGGEPVDLDALVGAPCYIGVDLASVSDLCAVIAAFPDGAGGYDLVPRFFVPAENIRRRAERDGVPYPLWRDQGFITATPGNVIDHDAVFAAVTEMAERFDVREVAVDRWNSTAFTTRLQDAGLTVTAFGQGYASMAPAVREVERAILARQLRHGGNPVLRWNFNNVAVETDAAGNAKFTKARSVERIDGAVATAMAVARAQNHDSSRSVYATRGLIGFAMPL